MEQLINAFLRALTEGGITSVRQMPMGLMPQLKAPVTAVGLSQATGLSQALYEYLGMWQKEDGTQTAIYGRRLEAEISLRVFCPRTLGAQRCMEEADQIVQILSGKIAGITLRQFTMGNCEFDTYADMFTCMISAQVDAYVYALTNDDETLFTDFILKGEAK